VCTLLIDLQPSDVKDPLAQFQATKATKEDIHQLVTNLNKALGEQSMDEALVNKAFEMW
jgi:lauroyl/myristoyl acyltransferase